MGGYFANDTFLQPFLRYRDAQALLNHGKYDEAASAFVALDGFGDSETKAKEAYYQKATALLNYEMLDYALPYFINAGDYSDAKSQADRIQTYLTAENDLQKRQYLSARSAYASLGAFQDAQKKYEDISKLLYDDAKKKLTNSDFTGAYQILSEIRDYADSAQIADGIDQDYQDALALWESGDKTAAEAALLGMTGWSDSAEKLAALQEEIADDCFAKVLLISRYGLDTKPYNTGYANSMTWEQCTLRAWLNSTFYNKAFNAEEQSAILLTYVDNSNKSQGYYGHPNYNQNNTQDKIFLLSCEEACVYFNVWKTNHVFDTSNIKARVSPTAYAINQGEIYFIGDYKTADGDDAVEWWLRSMGDYLNDAAYVCEEGSVSDREIDYSNIVIRPAFWLNLNSYIF